MSAAPQRTAAPPPSRPYKVDTSRPSLRTNWTRLVLFPPPRGRPGGVRPWIERQQIGAVQNSLGVGADGRLTEFLRAQVCGAFFDADRHVRAAACTALGGFAGVAPQYLLQTLTKVQVHFC